MILESKLLCSPGFLQEEARTASAHAKALRLFRKEELQFFAARAKYERAQADLQVRNLLGLMLFGVWFSEYD